MNIDFDTLSAILDAYPYQLVFADRNHIISYVNAAAKKRYGSAVQVGRSIFNCHNERSKVKIEEFLKRADAGENEMFETLNGDEREFFTPVRDKSGKVIGYFERHEEHWDKDEADRPISVVPYIPY